MEKFIIWKSLDGWKGTTQDNYNTRIQDARKVKNFEKRNGFGCVLDVKNFVKQFFKYSDDDIIIID